MSKLLTKKEAVEFLGLDDKTFDNYFKNAAEFACVDRNGGRGRFYFDEDALRKWKDSLAWRTVNLNKEDYALALDFALAMHFRSYVQSDFGTGRQREFDLEIALDFNIYDKIVPQDIIGILEKGEIRPPHIGISIKASKPKNAFLILGANEINIPSRRSEIYIYTRPDIPDDHIL